MKKINMDDPLYKLPENQQGLTEDDVRRIFYVMMSSLNAPTKVSGSFLQSANFVSGVSGWKLDSNGNITALGGTIGGWTIGVTTLTGTNVVLDSAGVVKVTQTCLSNIRMDSVGYSFFVSDALNAYIGLSTGSTPYVSGTQVTLTFQAGGDVSTGIAFDLAKTASNVGNLSPASGDTIDLGTSVSYFNEINYKTLTDRGCLGSFDEGVELQDGSKVSDIEAIKSIKKHPTNKTIYGVPMFDYSTMPKAVYKPAPIANKDIYENRDGKIGKLLFKKGEKIGVDGAETTALISIMLGAIKELEARVKILESRL
mgnify:CR=1 FL=1